MSTIPCETEDFAPLDFEFNGATFSFGKEDLTTFGFTDSEGVDQCLMRVAADPQAAYWTLGTPWFNKFYTAFNPHDGLVGFAEMTSYEDLLNDNIDVCESDMPWDVDIKQGLEMVEEMEEDLTEEIEDIVEEEEEVFEDAEEVMEEVFDEVEDELDSELYDDADDDDAFDDVDDLGMNFTDDVVDLDSESITDDVMDSTYGDDTVGMTLGSTNITSSFSISIGEKEIPVSTKTLAEGAGVFLIVALIGVVIFKRNKYSGRSQVEMGTRGPFDDWRSRGEDDGGRFVID